jgi:hypothetical protein
MISKILKIIDSCKTAEQIGTCSDWLNIVELSYDDRMSAIGAMHLKLKQMSDFGWANIGKNRFPVDDEQRD